MILLLSLFLLIYQTDELPAAKLSAVEFSAVKHGPIKDPGCIPLFARQITFRIKNRSDKSIYIYGLMAEPDRLPIGYLIQLDTEKNQWLNSEGNSSHPPYKEFASARKFYEPHVYVLPPGKSMKFDQLANEKYIGSRLKQTIYISLSQNEEPRMFTSEEFFLR